MIEASRRFLVLLLICLEYSQVRVFMSSHQIAVCISGQTSRWIPEFFFSGIIAANPLHIFSLFINLQYHTSNDLSSTFTTKASSSYQATPMNRLPHSEMLQYIHRLFTTNHSQVVVIDFVPPKTLQDWKQALQQSQLDRIYLYSKKQHAILNLYHHQRRCFDQMRLFEELQSTKFDFVINTREDIYYFEPIVLDRLFPRHTYGFSSSNGSSPRQWLRVSGEEEKEKVAVPTNLIQNSGQHAHCDLVVKNCLTWNGTNMRWQLFSFDQASSILQKRFSYYKYLYKTKLTVRNPEMFELHQYKHYRINVCEYSIEDIPATAIRYFGSSGSDVENTNTCFIPQEIGDNCIPLAHTAKVRRKNCNLFINVTTAKKSKQSV